MAHLAGDGSPNLYPALARQQRTPEVFLSVFCIKNDSHTLELSF
jgi:hypothetical protein